MPPSSRISSAASSALTRPPPRQKTPRPHRALPRASAAAAAAAGEASAVEQVRAVEAPLPWETRSGPTGNSVELFLLSTHTWRRSTTSSSRRARCRTATSGRDARCVPTHALLLSRLSPSADRRVSHWNRTSCSPRWLRPLRLRVGHPSSSTIAGPPRMRRARARTHRVVEAARSP